MKTSDTTNESWSRNSLGLIKNIIVHIATAIMYDKQNVNS
jgi:hypothetical protein